MTIMACNRERRRAIVDGSVNSRVSVQQRSNHVLSAHFRGHIQAGKAPASLRIDVRVVLEEFVHNCYTSFGGGHYERRPPAIGDGIDGRTGTK